MKRKNLLWILGLLNLVIIVWFGALGNDLDKFTIVDFEFANSLAQAEVIMQHWQGQNPNAMSVVSFMLGVDFLFLCTYSSFLFLACMSLSEKLNSFPVLAKVGVLIAWLQFVAAGFDCVENLSLYKSVIGQATDFHLQLAYWSAIPKFSLVAIGAIYIIIAFILKAVKK